VNVRFADGTPVVFLGDQPSVPSQQCVRGHKTGEPTQRLAAQLFAFGGQMPASAMIEYCSQDSSDTRRRCPSGNASAPAIRMQF